MKLADIRRLTIRKQFKVRFRLRNGMECVITEHGIAQIPELKGKPDFNLEEELASAGEFVLDPVLIPNAKNPEPSRKLLRDELVRMSEASPSAAAEPGHDDD
jgi:hypothetical protein